MSDAPVPAPAPAPPRAPESVPSGTARTACPFCGGSSAPALIAHDRNREISDERFAYRRCTACETVFLENAPGDLARYYGGPYYGFRPDGEPGWKDDPFLHRVEQTRIELIGRYVEPGTLIEIGAGTGGFAAAATSAGFDVTAIEMDGACCAYLSDRLGVRTIQSDQPVQALGALAPAGVVTMWHVLEHLANPREALAAAAARVAPGGVLALGVPNPQSLQFRLLRARWAHLDAPRHLCLIPAAALIERGRELGLSCVELTTGDPFGQHCNIHGWTYALKRRPGAGPAAARSWRGSAVAGLLAPVERRGLTGSALFLLLRKDAAQ